MRHSLNSSQHYYHTHYLTSQSLQKPECVGRTDGILAKTEMSAPSIPNLHHSIERVPVSGPRRPDPKLDTRRTRQTRRFDTPSSPDRNFQMSLRWRGPPGVLVDI